ncbi:MAG TPA: HD domain-containing phosphohydrolase [Nitrospiraceae bacterium]|nr:HD domain-containing phosphohydrolase [Nitrospiraceae bacterium]
MLAHSDKPTILIVEDEVGPRNALQIILRPFYNLHSVDNGHEALRVLQDYPIDLITLDVKLPDQSGLEVLKQVKSQHSDVEVVIITGYGSLRSAMDATKSGAAAYLLKPFNVTELLAIINQTLGKKQRLEHLRQWLRSSESLWGSERDSAEAWKQLIDHYQELRPKTKHESQTPGYSSFAPLLSELLEAYSRDLFNHANRTSFYAGLMGKQLGFTEVECKALVLGAFLHDIGRLAFGNPSHVMPAQKSEGYKHHLEIGARMILPLRLPAEVGQIILYHQEHYDGSGYPYGLQGEGIPLSARIVAIAEAFDHLTGEHPSRLAYSVDDAVLQVQRQASKRFDPILTKLLERVAGECAPSLPDLAASSRQVIPDH